MIQRISRPLAIQKWMLGIGFVSILIAITTAYRHPATSYEISIYQATPTVYWVGLGVSLGVTLLLSTYTDSDQWLTYATFALGYLSSVSFVALPLIRGYQFVGAGDSLTHLGWVKDISNGALDPVQFLYPGLHLISFWASSLFGVPTPYAIELTVIVFFALFLLFVPLCVRRITGRDRSLLVGLFSASLFLPINNISIFRMAHPFTQAILFLPIVFYLLFLFLECKTVPDTGQNPTILGMVLSGTSMALILVHPQLGLGLVLLFLSLTVLQYWYRHRHPEHPISAHRSLHRQTALVGSFFVLWILNKPRVRSGLMGVVDSVTASAQAGDIVSQRTGSASAIGTSPEVLGFKLFFPSLVFLCIAGCLLATVLLGWFDGLENERTALVTYLAVGLVPFVALFLVFLVSSFLTYYFRYLGAMMAIISIVGAVAISKGLATPTVKRSRFPSRTVLVVLFAVLVPLSLLTVFPSPYILKGSSHVSEQRLDGYQMALDQTENTAPYVGLRAGPDRFYHATYGTEVAEGQFPLHRTDGVPSRVFGTNLSSYYSTERYLPITAADRQLEGEVYDGFRYSRRGFRKLDSTPGINRVQSNGEFQLYQLTDNASQ